MVLRDLAVMIVGGGDCLSHLCTLRTSPTSSAAWRLMPPLGGSWLQLVLMAIDLLAWTQGITLDGEARTWEPKRLRYAVLHVTARPSRSGCRLHLRLQRPWRWSALLCDAFRRLRKLPLAA